MIVKGEIKALTPTYDEKAVNKFSVRIDLFESVTGSGEVIVDCQVINQPGRIGGYKVGDVVWVAFEKDKYDLPVIIGKIYRGTSLEEEACKSGEHLCTERMDDLIVRSNATLPAATTFSTDPLTDRLAPSSGNSGTFTAHWLYQQIESLTNENKTLKAELEAIKAKLALFPWTGGV